MLSDLLMQKFLQKNRLLILDSPEHVDSEKRNVHVLQVVEHPRDSFMLLEKLKRLNFSTNTVNWVKSFMSTRSQKVQVGGSLSGSRPIDLGVAQGSILGPLLFLLYVSDFESWYTLQQIIWWQMPKKLSSSSSGGKVPRSLPRSTWSAKSVHC
jgi:hypothetical protein